MAHLWGQRPRPGISGLRPVVHDATHEPDESGAGEHYADLRRDVEDARVRCAALIVEGGDEVTIEGEVMGGREEREQDEATDNRGG